MLAISASTLFTGDAVSSDAALVAADGVIRGTVATELRPEPGAVVVARAIDVRDATTAASGRVRNGAFRLRVPAGPYLILVEKIQPRREPVTGFGRAALVRPGATAVIPRIATGSATRTTRATSGVLAPSAASGPAAEAASVPAIAVRNLTVTGPDVHLSRGIAAMLVTDLWGSSCYKLVEWEQRNLILGEIRLQQSRWGDPATRVTPRLINPGYFVEGSLATGGARSSWNIRVRERATGRIVASDSGSAADLVAAAPAIGQRLRKKIEEALCGFPVRFSGTFTGENRTAAKNTYSGTISFVRNATSPAGTVTYRVERISWTHRITSLPTSPCTFDASTTVSVTNPDRRLSTLVILRGKEARGYRYAIAALVQSPRQLSLDAVCNGTPLKQPWIPGAALNTKPDEYTDLKRIKGRFESAGTASTYTWDLKASG